MGTSDDTSASQSPTSGSDAAREALARARAAARERGVPSGRPGRRPTGPLPRSGPGPDGRDPVLLAESVQRLIKDRGWTAPAAVAGVVGRWSEIVGAEIAGHVVPETFDTDQGRLVLRADSSAWASVMKLQVTVLAARIEQEVGRGVVRHVTVLGPSAPSWKHGPLSVKGRGPRDTYG